MTPLILAATTFAASAVEFVEAATIVLAVTVTHGWRTAIGGATAAVVTLAVLIGAGSRALESAASLRQIELAIGPFLVLFGIAWLRKAVWRYAGRKAMHDEAQTYARTVAHLREESAGHGFAVSFQGVFVEGLEVALIVITFAATEPALRAWSIGGASLAFAIVTAAAIALRAPFSRVPENLLKAIVGVMLLSLGTYWTGEGLGITWWLGDTTFFGFAAGFAALSALLVMFRRVRTA
jgi:Ca2+/H+ antiporter, TMEM165/GDT1 family